VQQLIMAEEDTELYRHMVANGRHWWHGT